MNQNNIATVLVLIASAIAGPVAWQQSTVERQYDEVQILSPTEIVVGQLVELQFDAVDVDWIFPVGDSKIVSDGVAHITFRDPGQYQIIAAGKVGLSVQVEELTVNVFTDRSVLPTPTPTPTPQHDLSQLVFSWCQEADADKALCRQVADNFITAASTTSSVGELVAKTSRLNSGLDLKSLSDVLVKVQLHLQTLPPDDYTIHQCEWDAVAQGLIQWSNT